MSNYDITAAENPPEVPQKPFRTTLAIIDDETISTTFELIAPDRETALDYALVKYMGLTWRNPNGEIVPGPSLHSNYVLGLVVIELVELVVAEFPQLPLGTRFRYINGKTTWVKLSNDGTIAVWSPGRVPLNWLGQEIAVFSAEGESPHKVIIVE